MFLIFLYKMALTLLHAPYSLLRNKIKQIKFIRSRARSRARARVCVCVCVCVCVMGVSSPIFKHLTDIYEISYLRYATGDHPIGVDFCLRPGTTEVGITRQWKCANA